MKPQPTTDLSKLTFTMLERAVIYARISGDDSKQEGRNLQGQLEMGRKHIIKKGYELIAELPEDERKFTSGADMDLPQLKKVLEMAHNREFDVLIVREPDRLSRDLTKWIILQEELRRNGVRIEFSLIEYADTDEGELLKNFSAVLADFERKKIIQRTIRGRQQKVKAGNVLMAGRPPYGYSLGKHEGKTTLEIVESEAVIVRLVFNWYLEGASLGKIAQRLSDMHVKTPNETGRRVIRIKKMGFTEWGKSTVSKILNNETYVGTWRYGKTSSKQETIPVTVPAIVTREIFEAVQAKRIQNKKEKSGRKSKFEFLLAKRLTCGCCGYKIVSNGSQSKNKTFLYYFCPARNGKDFVRECNLPTFKAALVDKAIWDWLEKLIKDPLARMIGIEEYKADREKITAPLKEQLGVTEGLIEQYNQELSGLLDSLKALDGRHSSRARTAILNDIEQVEKALDGLESQRSNLTRLLETQTLTEQQVNEIEEYLTEIAKDLDTVKQDFENRRRLIEFLDIWGTLKVENGQYVVYVQCRVGKNRFDIRQTQNVIKYRNET
ncbi:MAG: hypothetical protein DPW09_17795 [Anaerolineae bacterium]|nr:recombinase family protein [Anaerolineales bacterium]MCQ3975299.1 hypothetical protein [Anaerolineae bacterium]